MLKIKPLFVYSKYIPFGRFDYVTILWWVIIKMHFNPVKQGWEKPVMSKRSECHETWHIWQQMCLLALGVFATLVGCLVTFSVGAIPPWWVWTFPVSFPLGLYVLCWLIELVLPPYSTAYKDICFEGEARYHELDTSPDYAPFSFLLFIKNKDWRKLGEERFGKVN